MEVRPSAALARRYGWARPCRCAIAGHSYVELIAALFLIATAVMPVMGLLARSQRVNRQAQTCSAAASVARQELEALRSLPYLARPATNGEVPFTLPASVTSRFPNEAMQGTYQVVTTQTGGLLLVTPTLQQIVVRVRWKNSSSAQTANSPQSEVRLDTLVAREGSGLL